MMGERPGDRELGEQRVAGYRPLGDQLPADAEVPVHPPPSLAPANAGAGTQPTTPPTAPLLVQ